MPTVDRNNDLLRNETRWNETKRVSQNFLVLFFYKISYSFFHYFTLEDRFFNKVLDNNLSILDIGSGGGKEIFLNHAKQIVGFDASIEAVKNAKKYYGDSMMGDITKPLPFPKDCFDAVVSSHVLGHITNEAKHLLVSEIFRVLRPGGKSVHVIETGPRSDQTQWFIRWMTKKPMLFKKAAVDMDSHIGLECPSTIIQRMKDAGFIIDKIVCTYNLSWLPIPSYIRFLENGYTKNNLCLVLLVKLLKFINRLVLPGFIYHSILGFVTWHNQRLIRIDNSSGILISAIKPQ